MDYLVQIDNEEISELADVLSLTGRVNGVQAAAKVRLSLLEKLPKAKHTEIKLKALAQAFRERAAEIPVANGGQKVTL